MGWVFWGVAIVLMCWTASVPGWAQTNDAWDARCAEIDCTELPEGFLTLDLGPRRFQIPLTIKTQPLGNRSMNVNQSLHAFEYSTGGTPLRGYGRIFSPVNCCETILLSSGLANTWPFGERGSADWFSSHIPVRLRYFQHGALDFLESEFSRKLEEAGAPEVSFPLDPVELDQLFPRLGDSFWFLGTLLEREDVAGISESIYLILSVEPLFYDRHIFGACRGRGCSLMSTVLLNGPHTDGLELQISSWFVNDTPVVPPCLGSQTVLDCDAAMENFDKVADAFRVLERMFQMLELTEE